MREPGIEPGQDTEVPADFKSAASTYFAIHGLWIERESNPHGLATTGF